MLLCLIKGHRWLLNQWPVKLGVSRHCKRCGREETVYYETEDGRVGWVVLSKLSRI